MSRTTTVTILTGTKRDLPVQLYRVDDEGSRNTFDIPVDATVMAALRKANSNKKLSSNIAVDSGATGGDWSASLIIVELTAAITQNLPQGWADLEIKITESGDEPEGFLIKGLNIIKSAV